MNASKSSHENPALKYSYESWYMCSGLGAPGASNAFVKGSRKRDIAFGESGFIIGPCPPGPERLTFWPVGRTDSVNFEPAESVPSHRTLTSPLPSRDELISSIQLPSSAESCGPPKHHPLPVVRSTPIPLSPAIRTASPNAFIHSSERSVLSDGLSFTE